MKKEYVIWVDSGDEDGTDPMPLVDTFMADSGDDAIRQAVRGRYIDEDTAANYVRAQVVSGKRSRGRSRGETELNSHRIDLKPGRRAGVRRRQEAKERGPGGLKSAMVRRVRKPAIGRRKTVRTRVGRLVSRKSQKAVKRALFRSQVKKYPCPFCAREDFLGEKGLKKHIAKFHEAGVRSKRGYRTARSQDLHSCERCGRKTSERPSNPKQSLYREEGTGKYVCYGCYGKTDSARKRTGWRGRATRRLYRTARNAEEFTVILQRGDKGDQTWNHTTRSGAENRADSLSELHGGRVECPVRERGNTYIVDATKYYKNSTPYVPGNRRRRS